jgi:hypothetical protein
MSPKRLSLISTSYTTLCGSKFVEILDNDATPYSRDNVSLEDVLAETRQRSESQGSISSLSEKSPPPSPSSYSIPLKMRLRQMSVRTKR